MMIVKMKKFAFILILLVSILNCDDVITEEFYKFNISNQSPDVVYFYTASSNVQYVYPDTTIINNSNMNTIRPHSIFRLGGLTSPVNEILDLPSDTLSIYLFHQDTLNTYTWQEIRDGYKVLKRYDISVEDLQRLNFEIVYPPTVEMSEIKQYPPY